MNDPPSTALRQGTEEARSELDASLKTCWRQSHEIHSLNDTIAVYRQAASSLAAQNAELRRELARLRAQRLEDARPQAAMAKPDPAIRRGPVDGRQRPDTVERFSRPQRELIREVLLGRRWLPKGH
jgi:septal ring factor EnvC (AmiA/AmiB activator)